MSKLTPLSRALVLALPLLLTACGGSDNASTGNTKTGNNVNNQKGSSSLTNKHSETGKVSSVNTNGSKGTVTTTNSSDSKANAKAPTISPKGENSSGTNSGNAPSGTFNQYPNQNSNQNSNNTGSASTTSGSSSSSSSSSSSASSHGSTNSSAGSSSSTTTPAAPTAPNKPNTTPTTSPAKPAPKPAPKPADKPTKTEPTKSAEPVKPATPPVAPVAEPTKPKNPEQPKAPAKKQPASGNASANNGSTNHGSNENQNATSQILVTGDFASAVGVGSSGNVDYADSTITGGLNNSDTNSETPVTPKIQRFTVGSQYTTKKDQVRWLDTITPGLVAEDARELSIDIFRINYSDIQNTINRNRIVNSNLNPVIFTSVSNESAKRDLKTNNNSNTVIFSNFAPVLNGRLFDQLISNLPSINQKLDGRGVTVTYIDGRLDMMNTQFHSTPERVYYFDDPVNSDRDIVDSDLREKANHGTRVGLIIAGQRNDKNLGYAPGAKLKYIPLAKNPNFSSMYIAAIESGATVINNSYTFTGYKDRVIDFRKTVLDLENYVENNDRGLGPALPLFVYATGNQIIKRVKNYKTGKYEFLIDKSNRQYQPSAELRELTSNPKLQDSMIAVTGAKIDTVNSRGAKEYKKELEAYNALPAWRKAMVEKPKLIADSGFVAASETAVPCGDTKFSCLAAMDSYTFYETDFGPFGRFETDRGTSFSAPQVTGTIALVKQEYPWMSSGNLKTTVLTTATDVGEVGVDDVFGWGLLNVGRALRGPMQFAFGDFYANLGNHNGVYYFANNIFGRGGLLVNAVQDSKAILVLSGDNKYEGETTVNAGSVVIQQGITGKLTIRSRGKVYASGAHVGETYNNGLLVAKNTVVNGNFSQGSQATISLEADNPMVVHGTAKLNGTLKLDNTGRYISSERKLHRILDADKLVRNSYFVNQVVDNQVNYDIYYDYDSGRVEADIYRKDSTETAAVLASTLIDADADAVRIGAINLEKLFRGTDQIYYNYGHHSNRDASGSYFGRRQSVSLASDTSGEKKNNDKVEVAGNTEKTMTHEEQEKIDAAVKLQNSSTAEIEKIMYRASGSSFANSLASFDSSSSRRSLSFEKAVSSANLENGEIAAYLDGSLGAQDWSTKESKILGKSSDQSTTAGVYTKFNDVKVGVGATAGSQNWKQGYLKADDAEVTDKLIGVQLSASTQSKVANTTVYYGGSLAFTHHGLDNKRTVLDQYDLTSSYSANETRANVFAGQKFSVTDTVNFGYKAGLSYSHFSIGAIKETANNAASKELALEFAPQSVNSKALNLGVNAEFKLFGVPSTSLELAADWTHNLDPNFELTNSKEKYKAVNTLNDSDLVNVQATFKASLTKAIDVQVGAKYSVSNTWSDKGATLAVTYKF